MKLKNIFKKIFKIKQQKNIQKINRNVWLITGCSSGIGYELCTELLKKGYKVAAGLRKKERLNKLKEEYPKELLLLEMDVTDEQQVKSAIEEAANYFGKIDVLVNNAGSSYFTTTEECDIKIAQNLFDVNFWGYVRTTKNVLPYMRKQKSGLIINISSICGIEAFSGITYYSASKFAIEGFSEALRKEIKSLGIDVLTVNLSAARTGFSISKNLVYNKPTIKEYQNILKSGINCFENQTEYKEAKISPNKLAKAIIYEAEYLDNTSLYLGSECINIAINKYKTTLSNIKKQSENQYDVEYTNEAL